MIQKAKSSKGKKRQKGRVSRYDIGFRRKVAMEYACGDKSMPQVAQDYGLTKAQVKSWVKYFKPELAVQQMSETPVTAAEQKELEVLKKQLEAFKEKLEYEEMRNFALETMIDLAKEELGVDLRKNSGAKQPGE